MGFRETDKGGWKVSLVVLSASLLVLAAAAAVTWRYLRPSPAGPGPAPLSAGVSAAFEGDPSGATEKLLKALNGKLESLDLLKLLSKDVESRAVTVRGRVFPAFSETFRLPLRYSADQIMGQLDPVAAALGAHRLPGSPSGQGGKADASRTYGFAYDAEWTPVEITLAEIRSPKICLIIDDGGYQEGEALRSLYGFRVPVTVSIIPGVQFSRSLAEDFPSHGVEVMCHMPMEGHEKGMVGKNYKELIEKGMDPAEAEKEVERALDSLPNVRGLNNHMGSVATTDPELMQEVCRVLKDRGLFAIDSRTTAGSVVEATAQRDGVPVARRDVFLDNVETPEAILGQLDKTVAFARRHGLAVAIGHFKLVTLRTLEGAVQRLKAQGIQFVYASEVVK